jgi:hypothetical protein
VADATPRIPPAWVAVLACDAVATVALSPPPIVGQPRPAVVWAAIAVEVAAVVVAAAVAWMRCGSVGLPRPAAHVVGLLALVGSAGALVCVSALDPGTWSSGLGQALIGLSTAGNVVTAVHGCMFWSLLVRGSLSKAHTESHRRWVAEQRLPMDMQQGLLASDAAARVDGGAVVAAEPSGGTAPADGDRAISEVSGWQVDVPVGRQLPAWAAWAWGSTGHSAWDSDEEGRRIVVRPPHNPHAAGAAASPPAAPSLASVRRGGTPSGASGYEGDESALPGHHDRAMHNAATSAVEPSRWTPAEDQGGGSVAHVGGSGLRLQQWAAVSYDDDATAAAPRLRAAAAGGDGGRADGARPVGLAAYTMEEEWRVQSDTGHGSSGGSGGGGGALGRA